MKLVNVDFFIKLACWDKEEEYHLAAMRAILQGKTEIEMPDDDFADAMSYLESRRRREERLQNVAVRNNKGTTLEKAGRVDEAIAEYEDNVADGYPATHAFDRLMIIYRRRKDFENEIRIIKRAIEVFSEENKRRATIAAEAEPSLSAEIYKAANECRKVMGRNGFYCFVPYEIGVYNERLCKVERLQAKHGNK